MIYNEDFERGLLIGLAIAYKKAATAMMIGEFMLLSLTDSLLLRAMPASDRATASLPPDTRPPGLGELVPAPRAVSDTVSVVLG